MENPALTSYSPLELFTMKPVVINKAAEVRIISDPAPIPAQHPGIIPALSTTPSFWNKNKLYFIIGGVVLALAGYGIFYAQYRRRKEEI